MNKALPPLNWFRAFEAAARHLSFTAAAEEIGMTQSAVSQQIKSLEVRLGVPLFERKPRSLVLTDNGRRLLPQVDAALETLSAATNAYVTDQPAKLLTVSASVSVLQWVISPLLPGFRAVHPDLSLRFISAIWPDEFSRTLADVEIRFGSQKQAGPGAEQLGTNRLVALRPNRLKQQIDEIPLIETVGISGGWSAWGKAAGHQNLSPSLFVDSYGAALELAARGSGACLVHELLARHPLQDQMVEVVSPVQIEANEGYYLSRHHDTPEAQIFADWITGISKNNRDI